jgi:hypothetical protein
MWTAPHETLSRGVSCAKMNQFARMLFAGSARSYTKWCKSYLRARRCFQDPTRENAHAMEISRFCTFGPFLQDVLLAAPALQFLDQMGHTTPKVLADQLCKAFGRNGCWSQRHWLNLIHTYSYYICLFPPLGGQIMSLVPTGHRCKKKADKPAWFMDISHVLLSCSSRDHLACVGMQASIQQGCRDARKDSARVQLGWMSHIMRA